MSRCADGRRHHGSGLPKYYDIRAGRSYRIRNLADGHERIAREHELDKVT